MMLTNNIRDDVPYNGEKREWEKIEHLTDSQIAEKLYKDRPFLYYAWGIWVCAYGRSDLWEMILQINPFDCIYCDTDSVKLLHREKYAHLFDEYNRKQAERIKEVCKLRGLDEKLFYPVDTKGVAHPLGFYEYEHTYDKFKSLGSKKYCYELDGHFEFVVAGLRKTYLNKDGETVRTMTDMSQFNKHSVIPHGRTSHFLLLNQTPVTVKDYRGVEYTTNNKRGVAILETTYTFSVEETYNTFISTNKSDYQPEFENVVYDTRNKYTSYFRLNERDFLNGEKKLGDLL